MALFKHKNVASVYDAFVKDLRGVMDRHLEASNKAVKEVEKLSEAMEVQNTILDNSASEVAKATMCIKNIGEMFGVTTEG